LDDASGWCAPSEKPVLVMRRSGMKTNRRDDMPTIREVGTIEMARVEGGTRLDPDSYDRYKAMHDALQALHGDGFYSNEGGDYGPHAVWRFGNLVEIPGCKK
jgi:hypothetical protein